MDESDKVVPIKRIPKKYLVMFFAMFTFCCLLVFFGVSSSYEMHQKSNLRQYLQELRKQEAGGGG